MNYNYLKTKEINRKDYNQKISVKTIIKLLQNNYKTNAFSTFSYYDYNTSQECIENSNSSNCIGLSIYLKNLIQNKLNIKSFLIPAGIPKAYEKEGYLNISHVSLGIPIDENIYMILDPAFYFLEPIVVNSKNSINKSIYSANIFDDRIQVVESKNLNLNQELILNQYQKIPKNTDICECNYVNDKTDKWNYYFIEILNPDESISGFFLNIRRKPWITITNVGDNGICRCLLNLRFINNNLIEIKKNGELYFYGDYDDLKDENINEIEKYVRKYFKINLKNMLKKSKLTYKLLN